MDINFNVKTKTNMEQLMENDFFRSRIGKLIRWLLFLPIAFLAALLTGFVVRLAQAGMAHLFIAASAMSASAFMYCVFIIVPKWKLSILWFFFTIRLDNDYNLVYRPIFL